MAGYLKKSTQMVGLAVAKTPRETLANLYSKTLGALSSLPPASAYRHQAEEITKERLALLQKTEDVVTLEKLINCGQIEEVIVQASDELALVEKMSEWRAWEPLVTSPPPGQLSWP